MVVPHIIHFNRIVHDKPTALVIPHLCKPPYKAIDICCFDGVWPHPDIHPASSGEKLIRVSYSYGQGWSTPPRVLPFLSEKNTQINLCENCFSYIYITYYCVIFR